MPGLSLVEKRAAAMIANQEFILSTLTAEEQVLLAPKPATPTKSLSSPKKRTTPSNGTPGSTPGSRQSKRIKNYADQKREDEADYVESETEGSPRRKPVESPPPSIKRWKVNSKVSGHQTGIEVGRCFATRLDAHYAGIHAPPWEHYCWLLVSRTIRWLPRRHRSRRQLHLHWIWRDRSLRYYRQATEPSNRSANVRPGIHALQSRSQSVGRERETRSSPTRVQREERICAAGRISLRWTVHRHSSLDGEGGIGI